ncbi:MAG TPA: alpha-1,2-fucosyltransferase [Mycobacteriales bacterium]|nr:alpha-1,2-fucosyltransferase [Mycobacteriales bacterium]
MAERPPVRAVSLVGRMGNQLFQYAVARAHLPLSASPSDVVVVDDRQKLIWGDDLAPVLRPGRYRPIRQRELLRLRSAPRLVRGQRTALALRERLADRRPSLRRYEIGDDVPPEQLADRVAALPHYLLSGYFQNERYFAARADAVRSAFRPAGHDVMRFVVGAGGGMSTVGVSMRTGADYGEFGVRLDRTYYLRGIDRIERDVEDPSYVVFGDVEADTRWLVDQLTGRGARAVTAAQLSAADQLFAMAAMDHLVISNSSFAWWGAWLGDGRPVRRRIVVRPSVWVTGVTDICPDRWTAVDASYEPGP